MTLPALRTVALVTLLGVGAVPARADELRLTIKDGRVTLVADGVPVKRILEEWAKVGQSRIVNLDKLTGPAVTLRLENVPEKEALDVLLRSAAGYLVAPRAADVPGASQFDRILILATSRAPASAPAPTQAPPPLVPQPATADDEVDPEEGPEGAPPQPGLMPPGVQPPLFPQPNPVPFPGTGAAGQQQAQPPQPMTLPRPGFVPQPSDQATPPAGAPPVGVSAVPGIVPPPVTPASPTGTAQKPPPKKPGGGS